VHQEFPDPVKGYHWEIIATSWDAPEQVSFVNGVSTILEKHVDYVLNQITKRRATSTSGTRTLTSSLNTSRTNCSCPEEASPTPYSTVETKEFLDMTKFQGRSVSDKFVEDLLKNTDIKTAEFSGINDPTESPEEDRWE
jgi:hypothetical protein